MRIKIIYWHKKLKTMINEYKTKGVKLYPK